MDSTVSIQDIANKFVHQTNRCIFLTGKAGTGKTTFLKNVTTHSYKKAVVAAPTGIAAINAGGTTLHSLFQLPFGNFIPDPFFLQSQSNSRFFTANDIIKNFKLSKTKLKLLRSLELLIIDEVSMLRADILDAIDVILKRVRKQNTMAFGGLQILFIGDLLQLPPVVNQQDWTVLKNYYASPFFFDAIALKNHDLVYVELDKIYRQKNEDFVQILNNLRNNQTTPKDILRLNQHYQANLNLDNYPNYILLTTHNHKADKVNEEKLNLLKGDLHSYTADISGEFNENAYPVTPDLRLKIGAQVMFVKNDPKGEQRFFNGKIGAIHSLDTTTISVRFEDGEMVEVEPYKWENKTYELDKNNEIKEKILGSFTAFPIKLAWAITVHKSQGLTFDKAIIDLEGAFASGQVYVALSRLRSMEGLVLNSEINFKSIQLNSSVTHFSSRKPSLSQLEQIVQQEGELYLIDFLSNTFDYSDLIIILTEHYQSYNKDAKSSPKQKYIDWAKELLAKAKDLEQPSKVFQQQIQRIINQKDVSYLIHLQQRLFAAEGYFSKALKDLRKSIIFHIKALKDQSQVKKYCTELIILEADVYEFDKKIKKAMALVEAFIDKRVLHKSDVIKKIGEAAKQPNALNLTNEIAQKKNIPNTKQQSLDLYKTGMDIPSIAKKRSLTESTIVNHLCYFIQLGNLSATQFIEVTKIETIIKQKNQLNTESIRELKDALGDTYSYNDIHFALAYHEAKLNK